jgi:CheY-like chemotaxis protein
MLDRVFEAFVQQPQSAERSMGGLGLGLAIVRSLVVMHGGTVCARSDGPGRGSEFIVDLPLARASRSAGAAATTPAPAPAPAGRRVLVVDDNVDAASLLAEAITGMGHEVAVAHDGAQALRVAGTFQPEIALLDIGLPAMDGYELAGHLRAEPWATSLCLIALTGYGQPGARQRSADAGFNDHLVKPIDLNALERLLVRDAGGQPGV